MTLNLVKDVELPTPNSVYLFLVLQFAASYVFTVFWGSYLVPNIGCLRRMRLDIVRGVDYYGGARWFKMLVLYMFVHKPPNIMRHFVLTQAIIRRCVSSVCMSSPGYSHQLSTFVA